MKINISPPLRLIQWLSYACALLAIKVFIIFPLAVLLFHDLYSRLLPADSSSWVPFNTLQNENRDDYGWALTQEIKRIDSSYDLPKTLDNGITQPIFLRDHILYKMDLDLQFYCINLSTTKRRNSLIELELNVFDFKNGRLLKDELFSRRIPIVCLTDEHQTELGTPSLKYGSSMLELYRNEWLNTLELDDKIEINSQSTSVGFILQASEQIRLILEPESGIRFRMHSPQGLINLMLRWHRSTYVVGIGLFDIALTTLFGITALITFSLMSKRLSGQKRKSN